MDIYTLIKESLTAAAAIGAVYVANEGLKTWRRQLTGSNEYDLSRRVLRALYQWRRALAAVRHPMMWASESAPPEGSDMLNDEEKRFAGIASAYEKRWKGLNDARVTLESELLETEVLWNSSVRETCQELWKLQGELMLYLETHLIVRNPQATAEQRSTYSEILRSKRNCLYEVTDIDGGFTNDVNVVISRVESLLKPYLRQ